MSDDVSAEPYDILTPPEVKAVRKKLKLTQARAGELLGGGKRAFQKYESGSAMTSTAMSNLLRLLSNDPQRLNELPGGAP